MKWTKLLSFFKANHQLKILTYLSYLDHFWPTNAYPLKIGLIVFKIYLSQYGKHVTIPKLRLFIRKVNL